jgi:hypothetical protein
MDVRYDLNRSLTKFNFDGLAWFKSPTSQNFRQFINIRGIEGCGVLENLLKLPGLARVEFHS